MDEDFDQLEMECNNCHLRFFAPDLKLHPLRHELMCRNCLQFDGSKVNILRDRPLLKRPKNDEPLVIQAPQESAQSSFGLSSGYQVYLCESCQYVFKRHIDKFNGVCPYCSKKNVRMMKRK
ncbi:MAG: hypothetical protein AABX37_00635 [Nanoarchaeota archaeon]